MRPRTVAARMRMFGMPYAEIERRVRSLVEGLAADGLGALGAHADDGHGRSGGALDGVDEGDRVGRQILTTCGGILPLSGLDLVRQGRLRNRLRSLRTSDFRALHG